MDQEAEVKQVLFNYLKAGLIDGDVAALLSYTSENVMGIGMGEQGFVSSQKDIFDIMMKSVKEEENVTHEFDCKFIEIKFQSNTVACICAKVIIKRFAKGKESKSGLMQSLTVKLENGKWLITTLHASPIMITEESIEAYPQEFAENTLAHLKAELQVQTFDLINKSIPGGILGTYIYENSYPLYFINDGMLSYLGYTREEFTEKYGRNILDIIHADDKQTIDQLFRCTLNNDDEYEAQFRLMKKDGSFLWMVERGRISSDEAGKRVLLGVFVDITDIIKLQKEFEEQAKALAISEERFRIALEKTANIIFDYDLISGNIIHSSAPKKSLDYVTNVNHARDTLIIGGTIMEESMEKFNHAFHKIKEGALQSSCTVKVKMTSGKQLWNNISMTAVIDEKGNVVRAIGMIEDITKQKEAELAYAREEQYRQAVLSDALASYVINFSKDICESCQIMSPYCASVEPGEAYDNIIYSITKARLSKEDRRKFLKVFSKISVLDSFEKGITELKLEYHTQNTDGTDIWMQSILRLVLDANTSERKGFLYVTDIDKRKREELVLTHKAERDPMTGIYNKTVVEEKIKCVLNTNEGIQTGVFMIIDVDHFKEINDTYGHPFGDKILIDAAMGIVSHFRENDIVGRMGGDEFCVFYCGIRSQKRIEQAAEEICKMFQVMFTPDNDIGRLSCSIGITVCNGVSKTFEQIYKEADIALYGAKRAGRNGYKLF